MKITTWILRSKLPPAQKLVLAVLSTHKLSEYSPSGTQLARETGLSKSTVWRCIKQSEKDGLLIVSKRLCGGRYLNSYALQASSHSDILPVSQEDTTVVTAMDLTVVTVTQDSIKKDSISNKQGTNNPTPPLDHSLKYKEQATLDNAKECIDQYTQSLTQLGISPRIRNEDYDFVRVKIAQFGLEDVRDALIGKRYDKSKGAKQYSSLRAILSSQATIDIQSNYARANVKDPNDKANWADDDPRWYGPVDPNWKDPMASYKINIFKKDV